MPKTVKIYLNLLQLCIVNHSLFSPDTVYIFGPGDGSLKATLVVVVVGIPKAFLIRSATKLCISLHIRANIPYRSTVSDFPLIL